MNITIDTLELFPAEAAASGLPADTGKAQAGGEAAGAGGAAPPKPRLAGQREASLRATAECLDRVRAT